MFSFFSNRKVAALELQVAELTERLNKLTEQFESVTEAFDVDTIECKIEEMAESAVERAVDNVDFDDKAQDAIESVVSGAELRVHF